MLARVISGLFISLGFSHLRNAYRYAFVLINLVPLFGVLFLGWKAAEILIIYFLELIVYYVFILLLLLKFDGKKSVKEIFEAVFFVFIIGVITLYAPYLFFFDLIKWLNVPNAPIIEALIVFAIIYSMMFYNMEKVTSKSIVPLMGNGLYKTFMSIPLIIIGYILFKGWEFEALLLCPIILFKMWVDRKFLKRNLQHIKT